MNHTTKKNDLVSKSFNGMCSFFKKTKTILLLILFLFTFSCFIMPSAYSGKIKVYGHANVEVGSPVPEPIKNEYIVENTGENTIDVLFLAALDAENHTLLKVTVNSLEVSLPVIDEFGFFTVTLGDLPPGAETTVTLTIKAGSAGDSTVDIAAVADGDGFQLGQLTIHHLDDNTSGNNEASGVDGEPINTFTGELYNDFPPDLFLDGPMPISFNRFYGSNLKSSNITSSLGANWRHNFDWKAFISEDTIFILSDRGRLIDFRKNGSIWELTGKTDIPFQLVESGGDFLLGDQRSGRIYTFDSSGKLKKIEDGRGNSHTLTYTGDDLISVSDGLGRTLNFTYSGGLLKSVSDGTRTVTFTHTSINPTGDTGDAEDVEGVGIASVAADFTFKVVIVTRSINNLTGVTDVRGNTTTYSYDTGHTIAGLMTGETRPEGNSPYTQTYDGTGKVATQTDAEGNASTLSFIGSDTTITDSIGNSRTHTHSGGGELTAFLDEAGDNSIMGYDSDGRRNSITDSLGDVTTYTYHGPSGKTASVTNADGTLTNFSYTARTLSNGITLYDLTGVNYPDATIESFAYDANGNLTSQTDRAGNVWTATYNSRGQVLTATNPAGGVTTFTYNADGTLATSKDASNNTTTYAYDGLKRLITITRADATTRTFTYDNNDNLLTTTDERGNTTTFTYDDNNNLATMKDRLNKTTTFAYDGMDRVTSVTDPLGKCFRQHL